MKQHNQKINFMLALVLVVCCCCYPAYSLSAGSGSTGDYVGTGGNSDSYRLTDYAKSPWFSLITGLASIVGVLLAIYPIQIRNVPPSVFRSLIWQRSLMLSIGSGVAIFGGIQFYNQDNSPPVPQIALIHVFLRGLDTINNNDMTGPSIWVVLLILGFFVAIYGSSIDPATKISEMVISEVDKVRRRQRKHLQNILSGKSYIEMTSTDQALYDQAVRSFNTIETRIIEMYTGTFYGQSPREGMTDENLLSYAEEAINRLRGLKSAVESKKE